MDPLKTKPRKITNTKRKIINGLDYGDIKIPVPEKDYCRIEETNSICSNVFSYKNSLIFTVHVLDK